MRMMAPVRLALALACGAALLVMPVGVNAWGMEVHRWITRRALDGLPGDLKPFFAEQREYLGEHSADPDLWRVAGLRSEFGEEDPNHFFEPETMGENVPAALMPKTWTELVGRYGLEKANKIGRLPWRAQDMYDRLVSAFRDMARPNGSAYAPDNARYLAAVLAHYVEDAHQPFHAVANYDGQMTGQRGIHSRFETETVLRNVTTLVLAPVAVRPVGNVRDFIIATIAESEALAPKVLAADKSAASGREFYDDAYYAAFFGSVRGLLEKRLAETSSAVGSVIVQAWEEGGRPALRLRGPRRPGRIGRGGL